MRNFLGGWLAFAQIYRRPLVALVVLLALLVLAGIIIGPMEG